MHKTRLVSEWRSALLGCSAAAFAMIGAGLTPDSAAAQNAAGPAAAPAQAAVAAPLGVPAANGVGSAFELAFWQSLTGSEDTASFEAYLAKYPDGTFSGLARAKIAAMQRALTAQPAAQLLGQSPVQPAVAPAVSATPSLAPTPAVVTAAAPTTGPLPVAAAPVQAAEMIPASAPVSAPEQSSPLAKLLAQLRGAPDAMTPAAGNAPLVTAAPPVQPAAAAAASAAPALAPAVLAAAPVAQPQAYAPSPALASTPAAAPAVNYASARPVMLPVPDVTMPAYFCSNDARNIFHNGAYRPAVEAATRNNEAAVGYLRLLQQTYDRGQLGRDTAVLNAIAAEARAYQAEAARAYTAQAALVRQFDTLMTVPLRTCATGTQ